MLAGQRQGERIDQRAERRRGQTLYRGDCQEAREAGDRQVGQRRERGDGAGRAQHRTAAADPVGDVTPARPGQHAQQSGEAEDAADRLGRQAAVGKKQRQEAAAHRAGGEDRSEEEGDPGAGRHWSGPAGDAGSGGALHGGEFADLARHGSDAVAPVGGQCLQQAEVLEEHRVGGNDFCRRAAGIDPQQ